MLHAGCSSETKSFVNEPYQGPVLLGFDADMRQKLRREIVAFAESDAEPNMSVEQMRSLEQEFFEQVERAVDDFEFKKDEQGNVAWDLDLIEPIVEPYEAGEIIEEYNREANELTVRVLDNSLAIDIPPWTCLLIEDYRSGKLSGKRQKLLQTVLVFLIAFEAYS